MGGSNIVIEHEERCGDDRADDCPICRGVMSQEIVAQIEQAALKPGPTMTYDEAMAWLADIEAGSSHLD